MVTSAPAASGPAARPAAGPGAASAAGAGTGPVGVPATSGTAGRQTALPDPAQVSALAQAVRRAVTGVVVGAERAVDTAVAVLLAGGHLLIEDVPGLGKTTLATALARSLDLSVSRIQMTADLLPADVIGVSVYDQRTGRFRFHHGPVFAHVVVADELNRATPRTQSALLEAMGEGQVSVEGRPVALPDPFLVVATQNPADAVGTFPLPPAELDRFTARVTMGYPDARQEAEMLLARGGTDPLTRLAPVAGETDLRLARSATARVHTEAQVAAYVVALLAATRAHPDLALGASPRAGLALLALARARAVMEGRGFVTPDDVARAAPAALSHRLRLREEAAMSGAQARQAAEQVVAEVLARTPVPVGAGEPGNLRAPGRPAASPARRSEDRPASARRRGQAAGASGWRSRG